MTLWRVKKTCDPKLPYTLHEVAMFNGNAAWEGEADDRETAWALAATKIEELRGLPVPNPFQGVDLFMRTTRVKKTRPHEDNEGARPGTTPALPTAPSEGEGQDTKARRIFDTIAAASNGMTCKEAEQATGFDHECVSGRIKEMRNAGCASHTGERRGGGKVVQIVPGATYEVFRKRDREIKRAERTGMDVPVWSPDDTSEEAAPQVRSNLKRELHEAILRCILEKGSITRGELAEALVPRFEKGSVEGRFADMHTYGWLSQDLTTMRDTTKGPQPVFIMNVDAIPADMRDRLGLKGSDREARKVVFARAWSALDDEDKAAFLTTHPGEKAKRRVTRRELSLRNAILQLFAGTTTPVSAKDVHEQVLKVTPGVLLKSVHTEMLKFWREGTFKRVSKDPCTYVWNKAPEDHPELDVRPDTLEQIH